MRTVLSGTPGRGHARVRYLHDQRETLRMIQQHPTHGAAVTDEPEGEGR